MKPVRFGIVSTAKIARDWVIPAMRSVPECELIAIASRNRERAAKAAAQFAIPRHYGSLEELLQDSEVEAVYIPTPNSCHVDDAIAALRSGRHVLCEKPLGVSFEDAQRLRDVQSGTGLQISEALMVRYHPRWLAARDIIRSGALGRITQIHATYSVMNSNEGDIRFRTDLGGGALGDVGVYPIAAARFLFEAEPVAATATFEMSASGDVEIAVAGLLEFPGNRNLMFSGALRQSWTHWIHVTGTEGSMELPVAVWPAAEQETVIRLRGCDDIHDANLRVLTFPPTNQYEHEVRAFVRAIRGEIDLPWPLSDALNGMKVLDAVRESAQTNKRVTIAWASR